MELPDEVPDQFVVSVWVGGELVSVYGDTLADLSAGLYRVGYAGPRVVVLDDSGIVRGYVGRRSWRAA